MASETLHFCLFSQITHSGRNQPCHEDTHAALWRGSRAWGLRPLMKGSSNHLPITRVGHSGRSSRPVKPSEEWSKRLHFNLFPSYLPPMTFTLTPLSAGQALPPGFHIGESFLFNTQLKSHLREALQCYQLKCLLPTPSSHPLLPCHSAQHHCRFSSQLWLLFERIYFCVDLVVVFPQ